jgi:translocation and assembly module TamB
MQAHYADGKASGTVRGTGKGIDILQGQGTVPMTLSLKPFAFALPESTPLSASLAAKMDAAALAGAMPPGEVLKGRLEAQARIAGTLGRPELGGSVTVSHGDFTDEGANVALHDIDMQADLSRDAVTVKGLHAGDGHGGRISGSGSVDLSTAGGADVKLKIAHLNPFLSTGQVKGSFSADLALTGKTNAYDLKGEVVPDSIDITIPERFGSGVPQLNIVDKGKEKRKQSEPLKTVALDVKLHAPNRVFVRGWGLDAEFGGDLDVTGTLAQPLVNGTLSSIRGRYEEFSKRFDLTRANLRFQGTVPPSPYLDIEAQTKADTVTAVIDLTGSAIDPKIALSSVPALPQDEVLSHILFGKDMTKISPFQAIQLAGTLQRFTGHGSGRPGLLDTLRSKAGLDDLSVSNDNAGGTTVGAGKYITDKVYLQVGGGAAKNSGAATVKYQVTPHVTIDSKVGQDAQAGGGVSWSWDY